jgi:dTDP-4-amino-4,6-dideoxygalactose transaminase
MSNLSRYIYKVKTFLSLNNIFASIQYFFYSLIGQNTRYPKYLLKFEYQAAKFFNTKYSLTFSNGTTALNTILYSIGVKKNSKILISKLSFPSVISSILRIGAVPQYLDFDHNLQIALPDKLKIKNSQYLLITHAYGIPQKISTIKKFLSINPSLIIIEDISHAQGAKVENNFVGTLGDVSFMSMQGDKAISAGEGGLALTNKEEIYNKLIYLMHLNRSNKNNTSMNLLSKVGFLGKGRMSPLGAISASKDLKNLSKRNKILRKKFQIIYCGLNAIEEIIFPIIDNFENIGGFHYGFPFFTKSSKILKFLKKNFYITNYNWPNLDKNEKFNNPEKFLELIYNSTPNIDDVFKKSNDLRDELYFFDLSETIYSSDGSIRKKLKKINDFINEN